jgi:hypothetical protein
MKILRKIFFIAIGVFLLLILSANLILTFKSKEILQEVVGKVSKNEYRLEAERVSFYFWQAGISADKIKIIPMANAPKQAMLGIEKLEVRLNSVVNLVFRKNLEVLKIEIIKPEITTYANSKAGTNKNGIPEIIQKIQNTILQSIEVLDVKVVSIEDASLKIYSSDTLSNGFFAIDHINLHLTDIYLDKEVNRKGEGLRMKGALILLNPYVHFPDSNITVNVNKLEANVTNNSLLIDTLELWVHGKEQRSQQVKLSTLRISHLNWNRFLKEGIIELDTIFAQKGETNINLSVSNSSKNKTKKNKPYSGATFIIHHTLISEIDYKLHRYENGLQGTSNLSLQVEGERLYLQDFSLISDRTPAFEVGNLNVAFRNFKEYDNNQSIALDALFLDTNSLVLKNYQFETNKANPTKNYFRIEVPSLMLNNYDLGEVLQKKLDATSIELRNPDITIDIRQGKSKQHVKKDLDRVFEGMMQKVSGKARLEEVNIDNGNFTIFPTLSVEDKINIKGLSLVLDAAKFPEINDFHDFIHAIKHLDSKGFVLKGRNIDLAISDMVLLKTPRGIHFGSVKGNFGDGKIIDLKGVTVLINDSISNYKRKNDFHASAVFVESGIVSLEILKENGIKKKNGISPSLLIDTLNLQDVVFSLNLGKSKGFSGALNIIAGNLEFRDKQLFWNNLDIKASNPNATFGNTRFNAGSLVIFQPGTIQIRNSTGSSLNAVSSILFSAPELDINLGLNSTFWPSLMVNGIKLNKPTLNIKLLKRQTSSATKVGKAITQDIALKSIALQEPTIDFSFVDSIGMQQQQHRVFTGNFLIKDLHTLDEPEVKIGSLTYSTLQPKSQIAKLTLDPGSLELSVSHLSFNTITKHYKMHVDSVVVGKISHTLLGKKEDTLYLTADALGVGNFDYEKGQKINIESFLNTTRWWAQNAGVQYNTIGQRIMATGLSAMGEGVALVSLDSFYVLNRATKEEVWKSNIYEKGYETITGGKLLISGISIALPEKKPVVNISKFKSTNLHFTTEKDKTKLEDTIDYRPLLTQMFIKIPLSLKIDSVLLNNARVDAHEISKKTGLRSHILFSDINGYLKNVKTWDVQPNDTLDMRVRARFFGTDQLRLHFKQSYDDSLQGFWMRVRMSHFDMPEMNKLLTPLMGLKIQSGTIDSLLLVANGNDYFAYGTMDLRYHDLHAKIAITKDSKGKLLIELENFFVDLLLRNHDNGRTNLLFKERLRKRGIFNFWAKIGLEGLLTNLSIKRDKKERKRFENSIEKYNLPEKYWEDIDDLKP